MTITEFLTQMTRVFFALLVIFTMADFLRHRDKVRRDVALVFLCLSFGVLVRVFRTLTGLEWPWLNTFTSLALIAQPYLLLRLVTYFRTVPRTVSRGALVGMIVSWVLLLLGGTPLPVPVTLAIIAYFVIIDGYAVIAFIEGAFSSAGVVRQRLAFAAAGSGFLILTLVMAGLRLVLPDLTFITTPSIQVMAILTTMTYYLSFAPPRWLRQYWQLGELRHYLELIHKFNDRSVAGTLNRLCVAVSRAMGTDIVRAAMWDKKSEQFVFHEHPHSPAPSDIHLTDIVEEAWHDQRPRVLYKSSDMNDHDVQLMNAMDAETLLIVPIATNENSLGLLKVFLQHGSLFVDDDLSLLNIFAQQTAMLVENYMVLEELRDLTQDLEQKVQERTEALKRSNEELRQFAYIASHDLQEPLRTVTNYLQLIEARYPDKLDDDGREFIHFAVDGARRMKDMISALLTYSRVENRTHKIKTIDSQSVLDEACKLLEAAIDESHAKVTSDSLPEVRADGHLMTQVFQNLIGNAIKYRREVQPEIHVGAARENGHWVFSVRDNGIGMEPQYLDRIFVIFQRLHLQEEYPGTGIGLAVCKKVIELHGGRIWAESKVGKGTTFYFTLPT